MFYIFFGEILKTMAGDHRQSVGLGIVDECG